MKALAAFACDEAQNLPQMKHARILRTESGKPYFDGIPVHFSVSHTGKLWACLMSRFNAGLDVQEMRAARHEDLAARIFTPSEHEFTLRHGPSGFFEIWVRKEACVKYLGTGIAQDFKKFSVVREGELAEEIDLHGESCFLRAVKAGPGVKGAICSKEKDFNLCIRTLE